MGELKIDNKKVSKIGISNLTECLYNDEEIMLVYKEFKRRYDEAKTFAKKYQANLFSNWMHRLKKSKMKSIPLWIKLILQSFPFMVLAIVWVP